MPSAPKSPLSRDAPEVILDLVLPVVFVKREIGESRRDGNYLLQSKADRWLPFGALWEMLTRFFYFLSPSVQS